MCSRWEAASVRARRAKVHSYWLGAAVQLPLALDRSYKTGYGSTYRSGTVRRDQEASLEAAILPRTPPQSPESFGAGA